MHMQTHHYRYQEAKKATLWGAFKNISLALLKIICGITGHSHALFADGIHSLSDLLTDILVLLASRWGAQEADINHPYGHQRIETAGGMFLALLLILTGVGIAYDAIVHFFSTNTHEKPDTYVWIIAVLSLLFNECMYRYTYHTGKKIKSDLLLANAWHHRSDAASSLVVVIGITGALFGFYGFDLGAAAIVGLMIIKMGGELAWKSISELVDTGVATDELENISKIITQTPGVEAVHQLRTRSMGGAIFVDVHILVSSRLSVSEGHYIAEKVHENLIKAIDDVKDVTVHVDSEDDATVFQSLVLPSRDELIKEFMRAFPDVPWEAQQEKIILHYLEGKVYIEIFSDVIVLTPKNIEDLLEAMPALGGVKVY